jgi:hypothetical protein
MRRTRIPASLPKAYVVAFTEIVSRIARSVAASGKPGTPLVMYIAGGAAQFLHTGARVSEDIDAAFSRRFIPPENLDVSYTDTDGAARALYLDRQYNETFGLVHEDAHDDAIPIAIEGVSPDVVDVRLFSPTDLAVSKIARFESHDREDIAALARAGLVDPVKVRQRAEEALAGYVGDVKRVKTSIRMACRLIEENAPGAPRASS